MSRLLTIALRISVALVALPLAPIQVHAQYKPAEAAADSGAASRNDDPNAIVVSARKTKETLQNTPLAVSVITGESLERTGFTQVSEVARYVPGVAISPPNTARPTGTKIRGISTFSFSDGFESSVSTVVDGVVLGQPDVNNRDSYVLRGKLLFQPIPELKIKLTGDIEHGSARCCLPTFRVAGPPSGAILFATNSGALQLQSALSALGVVASPLNRMVAVRGDRIGERTSSGGVALNIDYDIGTTSLSSITAWRKFNIDEFNEADGVSNSSVNDRNGTAVQTEQFSQELRVNGKVGKVLDYVAGLYFFHQKLAAQGRVDINLGLPFPPFLNVRTFANRNVTTKIYATFGELTFNVTDKASLIFGGRYTHDVLTANYTRSRAQHGRAVRAVLRARRHRVSGGAQRQFLGTGVRSSFFNKSLTANVTIYDQQIRNLQTISSNAVGATLMAR